MAYSTRIEHTEESLRMLDEKFGQVTDDRFMYCLKEGKWDMDDLVRFKGRLELAQQYTSNECDRLEKLSKTFIYAYATNHNKYFTTAAELMSSMRSTLSAYRNIITEFRDTKGKRCATPKQEVSRFDHSALIGGEYSRDMFGWECYDAKAKEVFDLLVGYLNDAEKCLKICLKVIEDEAYVRLHKELYMKIYQDSFNHTFYDNRRTIQKLRDNDVDYDNDILKMMEDAEDVEKLIAEFYHMLDVAEFNDFVISKGIWDGRKNGLDDDETFLWGKENRARVLRVRLLLEHLNELEPDMKMTKHKNKLSGYFLMRLFNWCEIRDNRQHPTLLRYVRKKVKATYDTDKIGAVNAAKRELLNLPSYDEDQETQKAFNQQINAFVDKLIEEQYKKAN